MNRSKRFEPIARLAGQEKQSAAKILADARNKASGEQSRLEELLQYKQEYLTEFQRKARHGVAGLALRQFQYFVAQLDKAIVQQRDRLRGAEVTVEQKVVGYRASAGKSKALENVVENFKSAENTVRDKREQRQQDELTARRLNNPQKF